MTFFILIYKFNLFNFRHTFIFKVFFLTKKSNSNQMNNKYVVQLLFANVSHRYKS